MKRKERTGSPIGILLTAVASASLIAGAAEEAIALIPEWGRYGEAASGLSLALDALVLGIGLAILGARGRGMEPALPSPWVELASSAPVIIFSSAPLLYGYMEGTASLLPPVLLTARCLRILRLVRIIRGPGGPVLATLTVCELVRSLAGSLLPDVATYSASLRLLLVPEAALVLGSAVLTSLKPGRKRAPAGTSRTRREPQVGREELAGLLGKKKPW